MNNKIFFKVFIGVVFIIGAIGFIFIRQHTAAQRPSIILITLDALRPDHLGCYGYKRNTSPTIDTLARQGVIFTDFIAPSSHTAPSNASLITSTYPNVHNIKDWGYQFSQKISKTLPMLLKEYGYNTAFISDQIGLTSIQEFKNGFNTFEVVRSFNYSPNPTRIIEITDSAISWLKNNQHKQFFLWLYYFSPHGPYILPWPYDTMFVQDKYYSLNKNIPISEDPYAQSPTKAIPRFLAVDGINDVDYYIAQYDGEIRRVDYQIGRLLEELKKSHLGQNTVIIITSDHGEALGEHERYFCHANSLYDELIKIPLIISWDKKIPLCLKIDQQVRMVDLMPTILDILKIRSRDMQGQSFLPLIMHKRDDFAPYAYSEQFELVSVRTKKWKLIYNQNNGKYELYDLENDPQERSNIVTKEKDSFAFLRHKLDEYLAAAKAQNKPVKPPIAEENKENLRSLGYAQ
ncbi:MAG: sulfatase [Candidatus Omnitrophica bacterium]|nr:sulfatase [Candidatus Omnitrophota bacterium]